MSYVTSIESSRGRRLPLDAPCNALPDEMFAVRYDLARLKRELSREKVSQRTSSLWRYAELLPVDDPQSAVSLGEGFTPLLPAPRLASALGLRALQVKDE